MKPKIEIIHQDDSLLLVNKPPHFLAIPDRYAPHLPNLSTHLSNQFGKVYTVHRLDKETSGIICFARTEEAHKALSQQFQARSVEKVYYSILEGRLHQEHGIIEKGIAPSPTKAGKMIISAKGKLAITHYKVIEVFKDFTLVEADIKTGRTHQIRVHFESIGYPLMIDKVYGRRPAFYLSEIKGRRYKLGKDQSERPLMERSCLHAFRLCLEHPESGERQCYEAPLPKDLRAVLQQLRKWNR